MIRRKILELILTSMDMTDGFNLTTCICISHSTQTTSYQSFFHTALWLTNVRPRLQIDGIGVRLEIWMWRPTMFRKGHSPTCKCAAFLSFSRLGYLLLPKHSFLKTWGSLVIACEYARNQRGERGTYLWTIHLWVFVGHHAPLWGGGVFRSYYQLEF